MTLFPKQIWTCTVCRIHSDKFPQQNILAGDEAVTVSNWSWVKRMNKRCLKKLIQLNWSRCFYIVKSYLFRDGSPTKTTALREVRARNQEKNFWKETFANLTWHQFDLGKKKNLGLWIALKSTDLWHECLIGVSLITQSCFQWHGKYWKSTAKRHFILYDYIKIVCFYNWPTYIPQTRNPE